MPAIVFAFAGMARSYIRTTDGFVVGFAGMACSYGVYFVGACHARDWFSFATVARDCFPHPRTAQGSSMAASASSLPPASGRSR